MKTRFLAFMTVGIAGFALQLGTLALLTTRGWRLATATLVAVELAVLHNFIWHEQWTWRDRSAGRGERARRGLGSVWERLLRFQMTSGLTSLVGNVVLTSVLAHLFQAPAVVANLCAVAITSFSNFMLADRLVFPRLDGDLASRKVAIGMVGAWLLATGSAHAAPGRDTLDAWSNYVAQAERSMATREAPPCAAGQEPSGYSRDIPGGTIHRWRGCAVFTGHRVDALLHSLKYPGTPPPQQEIMESRVLARTPDTLRVYLRLRRRAVLTVTYDTEHEVTFSQPSAAVATSRSIATRIDEVDGRDRGLLWRLNSYWRYVQVGPDVVVALESLSLSRTVPVLLRPVASPVISSVARESVTRALEALHSYIRRNETGP